MLVDELKKRMFQAMKTGATVEKEVLRTALGEVTKAGDEATDERVVQVLKKLVKSNQETLSATTDDAARQTLEQELQVLQEFLPRPLSVQEIVDVLEPIAGQVQAAKGPGPAMGIAMKLLKSQGLEASGKDVQAALASIRQGSGASSGQ